MRRGGTAGIVAGCFVLASMTFAGSAGAVVLEAHVAAPRDCAGELVPAGSRGIAHSSFAASEAGLLTANLDGGPGGDWDLALFHEGEPVSASTAFGSIERAQTWIGSGERVVAQACRREPPGQARVALGFDLIALADAPAVPGERFTMESVAISGPEDVARLEALGLDVTHDVSSTAATVATYSDAERALLAANGFEAETLIGDIVAADAAARRAEARFAAKRGGSGLPSGRTAYREYSDYTAEMKDLAEDHPEITREVTIGSTLEGRPIQGLEIAGDVDATDDGRPVYLNMGVHHAREWPSGELPMEFAIDLVEGYGSNQRITDLLDSTRTFILPVVNVDGFIASRGHGTDPLDDDPNGHIAEALNDQNAYKRKNCRPQNQVDALIPCENRVGSGVDLNRNYGAYWGGPGSSSTQTAQNYRGTGPYSEPESEAVHQFTAGLHPTVFITNHTFTDDGKWLRQPGFDDVALTTPDESAMKDLGDDMAAATGWTSELGYETLGDITGATEDWNYFSQGTYGYTPEARGVNFHPNYADSVVGEYLGEGPHAGDGVREAFLIAGERAADPAEHSIVRGAAPAAATLRLHKEFQTPTCVGPQPEPCISPTQFVADELDTTLGVPASGEYRWHVNPSGRPLHQSETWTMSCELPGEDPVTTDVAVDRGEVATVDWDAACTPTTPPPPPPITCGGEEATLIGTPGAAEGAAKLVGTAGEDVIAGLGGRDTIRGMGEDDLICGGEGPDRLRGNDGYDDLFGGEDDDHLVGGAQLDTLRGGPGRDRCRDDGEDSLRGCAHNG